MYKNNMAKITGTVITEPQYDHETAGAVFYRTILATNRKSGYTDKIPVIFRKGIVDESKIYYGANISVEGSFCSTNVQGKEKRKLILFLFADRVDDVGSEDDNYVFLHGFICKDPVYRETPSGREITDLLVAINRPSGKSVYIPCICWAGNARYAKNLAVGSRIKLTGRIQSREYVKKLDEEQQETRVAYEVSASRIYMIEERRVKMNEAMRQYQGWIDINDRLPDPGEYVLVSFENVTLPDIGRYEIDSEGSGAFYPGNDTTSYASFGIFINAWMPLLEVYRREE